MSGPGKTPSWGALARALKEAGCTLTPYGEALLREADDFHCVRCGAPHVWHGRTEADRQCPECRWGE